MIENEAGRQWLLKDEKWPNTLRAALVWLFLFIYFSLLVQLAGKLLTVDGYYHIKMAKLLWSEDPTGRFRWLPYTVAQLGVNHNYLFHWLLVPFSFGDLFVGMQWAAAFFATLSVWSIYLFLRARDVKWPLFWVLFFLGIGAQSLHRLLMVRAMTVAVPLILLLIDSLIRRKPIRAALAAFLFMEAYLMGVYTGIVVLTFAVMDYRAKRELDKRLLVYPICGMLLGLIIHPQFPANIEFVFFGLFSLIAKLPHEGIQRGTEWATEPTWTAVTRFWPLWVLGTISIVHAIDSDRPKHFETRFLAVIAGFFFVLYMKMYRASEYAVPFIMITCALFWREGLGPQVKRLFVVALVLGAIGLATNSWVGMFNGLKRGADGRSMLTLVQKMRKAEPKKDAIIFNAYWGQFSKLFYHESDRRYVAGLEPSWSSYGDPKRFAMYRRIVARRDTRLDLNSILPKTFGARVVVGPPDNALMSYFVKMKLKLVFWNDSGFIFVVRER